jgi:hypothetical protein
MECTASSPGRGEKDLENQIVTIGVIEKFTTKYTSQKNDNFYSVPLVLCGEMENNFLLQVSHFSWYSIIVSSISSRPLLADDRVDQQGLQGRTGFVDDGIGGQLMHRCLVVQAGRRNRGAGRPGTPCAAPGGRWQVLHGDQSGRFSIRRLLSRLLGMLTAAETASVRSR